MSTYDQFEKIIFTFAVEAGTKGGQAAFEQVEYGHNFHFEDADALRYLLENAVELSKSSVDRLRGNIDAVIQAAVKEGKSVREAAKDVRAIFDNFSGYEAERIARTEIARATNAGAIAGYREMGIAVAEVVANAGACPICAALNGELLPTDKAMQTLPRHPNCYCFWIPRPDIVNPAGIRGGVGLGDIDESVVKGLGVNLISSRVSMTKKHARSAGTRNHLDPDEMRMIVGAADKGFVDNAGAICLLWDLGDDVWGYVPVKITEDIGLLAKTGMKYPRKKIDRLMEGAKQTYGL